MASSDEEGEIPQDLVTDYCFTNDKDEPVSFSILPFYWNDDEIPEDPTSNVFLHGATDGGLQKIHKKVIGWAFELSRAQPEIYVLSKDKTWIKLQKPRKIFEDTFRTIIITVHCLHFVKKNPGVSKDSLWNYLRRAFRSQMVEPSENDLVEHVPLIKEVASADKDIERSEYLATFLNEIEVPGKREGFHDVNAKDNRASSISKFIVDSDDCEDDEDDDENGGLFDSVCALCDNGGEVLVCEGVCIRSFHPTVHAGADSLCESLGFTNAAQYEAIRTFLCDNCQYERHQCFVCGMLGSSNKATGAEVFPCVSATCGHFYHPKCVAKLLYPSDENQAEELQLQIAAGESFTCPAHICSVCKRGENKEEFDLQFAVCRRCPKAYHRKCLPRTIAFEGNNDKSIPQRAWDDLLPKRILIYCMDHKIIRDLGTPKRDHLLFPHVEWEKNQQSSGLQAVKEKAITEKRSKVFGNLSESDVSRSAASNREKLQKLVDKRKGTAKIRDSDCSKPFAGNSTKDKHASAAAKTYKPSTMVKGNMLSVSERACNSTVFHKSKSLRSMQSSSSLHTNSHPLKSKKQFPTVKTDGRFPAKPVVRTETSTQPFVDTEMEKRILKLMNDATSSFNAEEFIEKQRRLCDHSIYSSRIPFAKTITTGKVEASVNKIDMQAVRAALAKLEAGCSIEEAKVVCEPEVLKQLISWQKKLKVYLAPFLYGTRYTSYGRHFTKVEKLKEIVNRLHWYVKDGDTIVDFCCGKNDFSCLMKEKLDKVGKRCSFKNYDLFTPSNDFSFEKRDWFTVRLGELPTGSSLIIGLNPPFGVQACLANQFIDAALKFKPKLLILIVPEETKRLDTKKSPYDLIWEDDQILSGKSFYLPGSVDIHGQQLEDWNVNPPPLYLWSRPDWTEEHKKVAQNLVKLSLEQEENQAGVNGVVSNYLMEEAHDCYNDFSNIMSGYGDFSKILDDVPEEPVNDNSINVTDVMEIETETLSNKMEVDKDLSSPKIVPLASTDSHILDGVPDEPVNDNSINVTDVMELETETPSNKMEVDKDLSSPKTVPVTSTDSQSIIGAKTYGDFLSHSGMDARSQDGAQGFQSIQPESYHAHNLLHGSEYSGLHTNIPCSTQIAYPLMSESAYPTAAYAFPTGASYGQSTYPTAAYVCPTGASYGQSAYPNPSYIQLPLSTDGASEPELFPPGTSPPGATYHQYAPPLSIYGASAFPSELDIFPPGTSPPGATYHQYTFPSGGSTGFQ